MSLQRLDPDGDITTTNWSVAPLWSKINGGATPVDSNFITNDSGGTPITSTAEVSLTNPPSTPGNSNTTVTVRGRLHTAGTLTTSVVGRLMQGGSQIGISPDLSINCPDATWVNVTFNTTNTISDFTDLRVRITASTPFGETVDQYDISWIKVDVSGPPDKKRRITICT